MRKEEQEILERFANTQTEELKIEEFSKEEWRVILSSLEEEDLAALKEELEGEDKEKLLGVIEEILEKRKVEKERRLAENRKNKKHEIRFPDSHNLGLYIYEGTEAELRYAEIYTGMYSREYEDDPIEMSPSKTIEDEKFQGASIIDIPLFEDNVRLSWYDLNYEKIEYTFDFNDIFPDKIIPYPKELEDRIVWSEPLDGIPGIIIEIINRTLNIYTFADIHIFLPNSTELVETLYGYKEKVYSKEF